MGFEPQKTYLSFFLSLFSFFNNFTIQQRFLSIIIVIIINNNASCDLGTLGLLVVLCIVVVVFGREGLSQTLCFNDNDWMWRWWRRWKLFASRTFRCWTWRSTTFAWCKSTTLTLRSSRFLPPLTAFPSSATYEFLLNRFPPKRLVLNRWVLLGSLSRFFGFFIFEILII